MASNAGLRISWRAFQLSFGAGYAETPQGKSRFRGKVVRLDAPPEVSLDRSSFAARQERFFHILNQASCGGPIKVEQFRVGQRSEGQRSRVH